MRNYGLLIVYASVQSCSLIIGMESSILEIQEINASNNKIVSDILQVKNSVNFQAVTRHLVAKQLQEASKKRGIRKVNPATRIKELQETVEQVITLEDGLTTELGDLCTEAKKTFNKDRIQGIAIMTGYMLCGGGSLGGALYFSQAPNIETTDRVTGAVPLYTTALAFFYQGYAEFQKVWGDDYIKNKMNENATNITFVSNTKRELENEILKLQKSMKIDNKHTKQKKNSNELDKIEFRETIQPINDEFNELSSLEVIQEQKNQN